MKLSGLWGAQTIWLTHFAGRSLKEEDCTVHYDIVFSLKTIFFRGRLGNCHTSFAPDIGWRRAIARSTRMDLTLQDFLELKRFSNFEGLSEF